MKKALLNNLRNEAKKIEVLSLAFDMKLIQLN
jgi:hypothetical protein